MTLPDTDHVALDLADGVLHITFDRPDVANALNTEMVDELERTFASVRDDRSVRAIVLRGRGKHFCAGADLKSVGRSDDEQGESSGRRAAVIEFNRRFGELLATVNAAPQAVVVVAGGAALGGGFGLLCVSDVAIVTRDAKMGMPETRLGLPAAQILPFVVERIGVTQARRIAMCGRRFDGAEAQRIGVAHELVDDADATEQKLGEVLAAIRACAPGANAITKQIIGSLDVKPMDRLLGAAAEHFADCLLGEEGAEGTLAFIEKRPPIWEQQ